MQQLTDNERPDSVRELLAMLLKFVTPSEKQAASQSEFIDRNSEKMLDRPEVAVSYFAHQCESVFLDRKFVRSLLLLECKNLGVDNSSCATASALLANSGLASSAITDSNLDTCKAGSQDLGSSCVTSSPFISLDVDSFDASAMRLIVKTFKFPRMKRYAATVAQDEAMMKLRETLETLEKKREEERDKEMEREGETEGERRIRRPRFTSDEICSTCVREKRCTLSCAKVFRCSCLIQDEIDQEGRSALVLQSITKTEEITVRPESDAIASLLEHFDMESRRGDSIPLMMNCRKSYLPDAAHRYLRAAVGGGLASSLLALVERARRD
ncbi:unnamed protein product [Heligmosomoides polygyrus]|uniref:tRNA-uridine aminocarboxypropyltransferase n=1 Tax=Heligmosomoides polygyrus TaxID=6339 RepID=A0A183F829_HELPZ|nr:unnamed protein product [Heligmosomoides polygyrus]